MIELTANQMYRDHPKSCILLHPFDSKQSNYRVFTWKRSNSSSSSNEISYSTSIMVVPIKWPVCTLCLVKIRKSKFDIWFRCHHWTRATSLHRRLYIKYDYVAAVREKVRCTNIRKFLTQSDHFYELHSYNGQLYCIKKSFV